VPAPAVKDIDFTRREILGHEGKGADRLLAGGVLARAAEPRSQPRSEEPS